MLLSSMPVTMAWSDSVSAEMAPEHANILPAKKEAPVTFTAEGVRAELTARIRETVKASPGDTVKARLRSAARMIGLPVGRIQDYWHGEVRRIEAHEADQIRHRAWIAKQQRIAKLEADYRELRRELLAGPAWVVAVAPPALGGEDVEP
jgi:hypothetical protein